jgi:hypothetical protein
MQRNMTDDKNLERMIRFYNSYEDNTQFARNLAEKARNYYDGYQWTEEEKATLMRRGQPIVTINRIAPKVDFITGMEAKTRTDPKAHPREPNDEPAAEVATATIRYVCDENDFDNEWSLSFENGFIEGTAALEVAMEPSPDGNEGHIVVRSIPWDRFFIDPHSRYLDGRDAKFLGEVVWMDVEDAIEDWPESEKMLRNSGSDIGTDDETTNDRPRWLSNGNDDRQRIKVVHMQYRHGGEWWMCTFVRGGFLEAPEVSPYQDRWGRPDKSIYVMSIKIDRENNRYGAIKHLLDIQDEVNHRRSKALHLLSNRQSMGEKGAIDDVDKMRTQINRSDGYVEYNPGKQWQMIPHNDMVADQFTLLQESKNEIDAVGANAALAGKEGGGQSGRAIQARQQGGTVELEAVFSRMRKLKLEVYKAIWLRAKQFWSAQRWIRVSGEDNKDVHLVINKEVTLAEMMIREGKLSQEQLQEIMQTSPETAQQLGQVVAVENNLGEMNADITIDEAPDIVTLSQEQFETLAQMASSGVPIPPTVLIKASTLRNKQELIDLIESGGATPEQQQAAAQAQQQQQAIQMEAMQLEFATKTAELEKLKAETEKVLAEVVSERAEAMETLAGIGKEDVAQSSNGGLAPAL